MNSYQDDFQYSEKPLSLVSVDPQNGKFLVNHDTLQFIKSVPEPVAVISVAGLYRTGKSYLLNKMLLNTDTGFGVGPTINPCTKGLWIWGKPLRGKTPEGEDVNVLVMDSEGIGALDQDSNHDTRVFSLAILFASCFLYNSTGSIDEQALENLSLVVNLTKTIHIKASNNEEVDIDDYSKHFPSFVWIVRDFTLQLLDAQGESITSKEYLEKALQPQKGFSDNIEQKNRIRRHISGLFKDRDCFTFVRPVTKEEDLQNLNHIDFTDLRPEFVEQVLELRKKVLGRIIPKTLNGKTISGDIFAELIKSYIGAINEGAVPNIENAWTQICRNECHRWANEALKTYETYLVEEILPRIPMSEEQLKLYNRRYKEKAIEFYKTKALGEVADVYEKELSRQIKSKYAQLKMRNMEEGERLCEMFLNKEYGSIDKKVRNNEYTNFLDLETDIGLFYTYFMEKGPDVPRKENILLEFLHNCLKVAGSYFVKNLQKEVEVQKTMSSDVKSRLDNYINELKSEHTGERTTLLSQLSQIQTERTELELREATLRQNIQDLKSELGSTEKNLREELTSEKAQSKETIEKLREKLNEKEDKSRELENQLFLVRSEFEKEKALLVQKSSFLEKSLEEYQKRQQGQQNLLDLSKNELNSEWKEASTRYESTIKSLQDKVQSLYERIHEQEDIIKAKEVQIDNLFSKHVESTSSKDEIVSEFSERIKSMEADLDNFRKQSQEEMATVKSFYDQKVSTLTSDLEATQSSLKQKEEQFKQVKSKLEKDNALLIQKLEFTNLQFEETRSQLEEARKSHDNILQAFEKVNPESSNKVESKQLVELKEAHDREIKQLTDDYESNKKKLNNEIETLVGKANELELKIQLLTTDHITQYNKLKEEYELCELSRKTLADQNKALEGQKKKMHDEIEGRYSEKFSTLERQMEEKDKQHEEELSEMQQKSEESILQLKCIFEQEKLRYEKRIQDEKDRTQKTVNQHVEELEQRLQEEQNAHEEEMEAIQEELKEKESQYQLEIQQLEHECSLRQQNIETLEKYLKETKESLNSIQANHSVAMEQHLESFNKERKSFLAKIESMSFEVSKNEKELFSMKQRNEQLELNLNKREETIEVIKKEYAEEKSDLMNKIEEIKQKMQKISDEYLEKKVEFGKESALNAQQNEFLKKRIEEISKQNEEMNEKYDEKLKNQKKEFNKEISDITEKFNSEKIALEEKYENKRKAAKESEANYQKQLSQLEKEKAILTEKLHGLENKGQDYEKRIATEIEGYLTQIAQLKDALNVDKKGLQTEIERLRIKSQESEHEIAEISSNYERDKALWEGKFNFLEQQRDQAKSDLIDTQKKFEITLLQLQKLRANDKEESESSQNALITSIEKRYNSKIQELQESYQHQIDDLNDKKTKLEKELKTLSDKMLLENYGKIGSQNIMEKKVADLMENEKKLLSEIEELKAERDSKSFEIQKKVDRENEVMKTKIKELEQKYKESENKKNILVFEQEKEKAKWNLEKDYLSNQNAELKDNISKLEKKKETLLRENEKLRNDTKNSKRLNVNTSFNTASFKPGSSNIGKRDISPSPANASSIVLEKENFGTATKHNFGIKPFEQYKLANLSSVLGKDILGAVSTRSNVSVNTNENSEEGEFHDCEQEIITGTK